MGLTPEEKDRLQNRIRDDLRDGLRRKNQEKNENTDVFGQDKTSRQKIEEIRQKVENEFYSNHPDYVQYVNRYGIVKWILSDELKTKREKGKIRKQVKLQERLSQYRNYLLWVLALLIIYVGFRLYQRSFVPPIVKIETNTETGFVFVDNQISQLKPNSYGFLEPGNRRIGFAARGFRTQFKEVLIKNQDTTVIRFELEPDSTFDPDLAGLWRSKVPPAKPDDPYIISTIRNSVIRTQTPSIEPKSVKQSEIGSGGVFITSNESDAVVYVNGVPTPLPQNTMIKSLPTGELTIELRKNGYLSMPSFITITRTNPNETSSLAFELSPVKTIKLTIKTEPIIGEIKFDGVVIGKGSVTYEPPLGPHTISFGDVIGFTPPIPRTIEITDGMSETFIVGQYRPSIDVLFHLDETGQVRTKGVTQYQTGYWLDNKGTIQTSEYGPEVLKTRPFDFFVFQMGPGLPNANPSGNDYIELTFNLPSGYDAGRSLSLVLEGYATNRNFQFNLTKVTEIAIHVNNQIVQTGMRPSVNIDENRTVARDVFPIGRFLKSGTNKVLIRTTDNSKCYYLLKSMRIE